MNTEVAAVADPEIPRTRERLSTGARSRRRAKAWHSPCSTCRGWRSANAAISKSNLVQKRELHSWISRSPKYIGEAIQSDVILTGG